VCHPNPETIGEGTGQRILHSWLGGKLTSGPSPSTVTGVAPNSLPLLRNGFKYQQCLVRPLTSFYGWQTDILTSDPVVFIFHQNQSASFHNKKERKTQMITIKKE
jgi:hypothetical protein